MSENLTLSVLDELEAEAIFIIREVAAEFERPVMMYSIGKDSSVLLHLARKSFQPAQIPFPLLHIDTAYKFPEMYAFRDRIVRELGLELRVSSNHRAIAEDANPWQLGTASCCGLLKTQAFLDALREGAYDAIIGGARREEERSRAKERIFSFRDTHAQWNPRRQRPELWQLYNGRISAGESIRVFPLSNWTELDIWRYIAQQNISVVPLYFAAEREVIERNGQLIPVGAKTRLSYGEESQKRWCRFRTLGCYPCTGAVASAAGTVEEIIEELLVTRRSERTTRVIDYDQESSMEQKKRDGYF